MREQMQELIFRFARNDRPLLNRIVVFSGCMVATNAHVSFMCSTDMPDGHYDHNLMRIDVWPEYPLNTLLDYFAQIPSMQEVEIGSVIGGKNYLKIGHVCVANHYWGLTPYNLTSLRVGALKWVSKIVAGSSPEGLFIIAGIQNNEQ